MEGIIRAAVIGVGRFGINHANTYKTMPNVELVGIADLNAQAVSRATSQLDCQGFTDPAQLLGRVDAVSIAVPAIFHRDAALPFLQHGVHILMEKPLAVTYEESLDLINLAERAGVIFQVGHLERFSAGVMALSQRLQTPRFFEVHRLCKFAERAMDVDVILDLMIHDIDIVLSLTRSPVVDVAASGAPVLTNHVDIANARLEFANGAVANVTASRVSNKSHRRIRVFDLDHYYGLDYGGESLEVVSARRKASGEGVEFTGERIDIEARPPLRAELEAFIESVRTGRPPLVTGRDGLEAVRVAGIIKEKIRNERFTAGSLAPAFG